MTTSPFFKDWWAEARANGGFCSIEQSWWDSDGSKPENKRTIPAKLSDSKLFDLIAPDVIMQLPSHYYANYTNATWKKLASKVQLEMQGKTFSCDGRKVDAVFKLNVFTGLHILNVAQADVVHALLTRWEQFCREYPGAGMNLSVRREGKEIVIQTRPYRGCNAGERLVFEAAFDTLMADLKTNQDFGAWVTNIAKQGGRYNKTFRISEDIWFGPDNPTMDRVRIELDKERASGKREAEPPVLEILPI